MVPTSILNDFCTCIAIYLHKFSSTYTISLIYSHKYFQIYMYMYSSHSNYHKWALYNIM